MKGDEIERIKREDHGIADLHASNYGHRLFDIADPFT